jgi:hypothetical protein
MFATDERWYTSHPGPSAIKIEDIKRDSYAIEKFMIYHHDINFFDPPKAFSGQTAEKNYFIPKSVLFVENFEKYKEITMFKALMIALSQDTIQTTYPEIKARISQTTAQFRFELNEIIKSYNAGATLIILLVSLRNEIIHFKFYQNTLPHYTLVLDGKKDHFNYPQTILVKTEDDRPIFIKQHNKLLHRRMSAYEDEDDKEDEEDEKVEQEYFSFKSADKSFYGKVFDISMIRNFIPLRIGTITTKDLNDMLLRIRVYPIEYIEDFYVHLSFDIKSVTQQKTLFNTTYLYFLYYATFYEMSHRIKYFIYAHQFYDEIKDKNGEKFRQLEEAHRILNKQLCAIREEVKTLLDNVNKKNEESEEESEEKKEKEETKEEKERKYYDEMYIEFYMISVLLTYLIYEVEGLRSIIIENNPRLIAWERGVVFDDKSKGKKSDFLHKRKLSSKHVSKQSSKRSHPKQRVKQTTKNSPIIKKLVKRSIKRSIKRSNKRSIKRSIKRSNKKLVKHSNKHM